MQRIDWDTALDTGNATVDGQHRELVGMLNRLREAEERHDPTAIPATLEGLSAYVATHFACEHDLMVKHQLDAESVARHIEEHRLLTERTRTFVLEYRRGDVESVTPLIEFLLAWLTDHVEHMDRELVERVRLGR